jgi:hypothetical protein
MLSAAEGTPSSVERPRQCENTWRPVFIVRADASCWISEGGGDGDEEGSEDGVTERDLSEVDIVLGLERYCPKLSLSHWSGRSSS